jgi:hypothetical protein
MQQQPELLAPPEYYPEGVPFDGPVPPEMLLPDAGMCPVPLHAAASDPTLPLMSYTRLFDGTDADLLAELRDYIELNGELRSGGWKAYLHRSEDFIRFTSHRMIHEMLTLHGGAGKRRIVFTRRNIE